ncbi:hypothetical protein MJ257_08470 [Paenibacillus timonensis]|uniref:Lipopolysaccharide assembly protein A domain-containing protein n=1 Tax=Paenibacillus timonensis TaxID=225915 RepID=A0ABW3SBG6_9BACL|nr:MULTISPECIES: hypothetical protein [Paenibacillus]MCH1640138.1 hypothetical protein [Paenibacillus timonensis]MDU2242894.1 hypothetical protein [Paenibacillus sp.]
MLFFEKTNKLSNVLLTLFVLFLILSLIFASSQFTEVLSYNFTNDLRGTVWMIVCFVISVSSLIAGVALKVMKKEANYEMKRLEERMRGSQP